VSDYERETRTSTPDGDATVRERTTVDGDTPDRTVVVHRSSGAGAWILAALVAVVAIIAVVWMMNSRTGPTNDEISAAMDSSRAAGYVEGASTALSNVTPQTTLPAPSIDTGSVIASQSAAQAAADARAAAERAADSAQNAAASVSANTNTDTSTNTTP